jgi:hypothetical protein
VTNWNGNRLDSKWRRWCVDRRRDLQLDGLCAEDAAAIAIREARGRRRIGRLVGRRAAMGANLLTIRMADGSLRFFLRGNIEDVPRGNQARVRELTEQTVDAATERKARR